MPSTLSDPGVERWVQAQSWCYRIGAYVLINFVDDPAWLALMFC